MKQLQIRVNLAKPPKTLEFDYDPNQHANFSDLVKYLDIGFEFKKLTCIGVTYTDNDNDTITVSSDEEWSLALETITTTTPTSTDSSTSSKLELNTITRLKSDDERRIDKENRRQEKLKVKHANKMERIQHKLERKERKILHKIGKHQSSNVNLNDNTHTEIVPSVAVPVTSAADNSSGISRVLEHPLPPPPLPPKHLLNKKVEKLTKKMDKIQEIFEEKQSKLIKRQMKMKAQAEHGNLLKEENERIAHDDIELYDPTTQEFQSNLPPHIQYIYIDANNMLYITYALRTIVLFNKDKQRGENLLVYIARLFQGHLQVMLNRPSIRFHVCFDSTSNNNSHSNNNNNNNNDSTFVVSSAQDFGFEIADDMLADLANNHNIVGDSHNCLFVTSDRGLRKRLKDLNANCVGSGQWLKFCYFHLCGETANIDMNQWMMQLQNEM